MFANTPVDWPDWATPQSVPSPNVCAVVGPLELLQRLRRVGLVPAVGLGVLVERQDQPRLHELAVDLVALVAGEDVRRVVARGDELGLLDPAREVAEGQLDRDVRVLLLELLRSAP